MSPPSRACSTYTRRQAAVGRTLIAGAGFGVLATESVVAKLCVDLPTPTQVRVDALPSVEVEAGGLGEALAATILDGLPEGGRRYENGQLKRTRLASDLTRLTLPDGTTATTSGWPSGELLAAQRASGAPFVVSATSELPTNPAIRMMLPVLTTLLSITPLRAFGKRRLAAVKIAPRARPREHSWGHARVLWPDGSTREGWLRTGDASTFTPPPPLSSRPASPTGTNPWAPTPPPPRSAPTSPSPPADSSSSTTFDRGRHPWNLARRAPTILTVGRSWR